MKNILFLVISFVVFAQKTPEDFGYKHLIFDYKKTAVDVIIKSKKGEENISKPLFLFCQGSLPQPVIKYDEIGLYQIFPFDENDFLNDYHLVIIGKPGIPIISNVKYLKDNYQYLIGNDSVPKIFSNSNYLDFYVDRNDFIIKKLLKEKWVSKSKLVLAGHSEGSTIAAKLALKNKMITHLIYSGGNPYGRILNILQNEIYHDKTYKTIEYWKDVVMNKETLNYNGGDTYKATYDFSEPSAKHLKKLKIPVLISFGTKDWSTQYNDLFYIETIRSNSLNFTFSPYIDLEHNYFPLDKNGKANHEIYNWEDVGRDWLTWINKN